VLPVYGTTALPENFHFSDSLDAFDRYFVNPYADHHMHEFLALPLSLSPSSGPPPTSVFHGVWCNAQLPEVTAFFL
ncbi:hypothetical protein B0H14DRAFT_2406828, partial [Mycena olivaceomarginata]